ncbi:MAG: HK97-gp10 family putative phage morphogenesis protein [Clostridium sp.]
MAKVKGLESLLKKLSKLGGDVEEVMFKSMQKQSEIVKGEAKLLCPVDSGDLRQSIYSKVKRTDGKVIGVIYTNSDHAAYVEFGTGKVGESTNKNTEVSVSYKQEKWLVNIPGIGVRFTAGQPAQPYMYPALRNNREKIIENIKDDLRAAIRKVANS